MALRPKSGDNVPVDRESAQQDGFLREVDEALREDEMISAFKRYGRLGGIVLGAGLLALAGYLYWDYHKAQAAGERGEKMTMALDRIDGGQAASAEELLTPLAKDSAASSRANAQLLQAGLDLQQGRKDAAVKAYAAVAADSSAPQVLRDLAKIRGISANFDAMPPQAIVDQLKPLAIPGNPWFGSAGELAGMAYLKMGKNDLAGPLFAAVSKDKTVPDSLRNRTRQLAGLLGVDAVEDQAATTSSASAPAN